MQGLKKSRIAHVFMICLLADVALTDIFLHRPAHAVPNKSTMQALECCLLSKMPPTLLSRAECMIRHCISGSEPSQIRPALRIKPSWYSKSGTQ
jgi:hypothetical protein